MVGRTFLSATWQAGRDSAESSADLSAEAICAKAEAAMSLSRRRMPAPPGCARDYLKAVVRADIPVCRRVLAHFDIISYSAAAVAAAPGKHQPYSS